MVTTMVDHELNELRREFLDEAREKISEMQVALSDAASTESLERLAYLAHQLKGSGGSYGYQRISDDAAELEKSVETVTVHHESVKTETLARWVTSLREEIERAASELA